MNPNDVTDRVSARGGRGAVHHGPAQGMRPRDHAAAHRPQGPGQPR